MAPVRRPRPDSGALVSSASAAPTVPAPRPAARVRFGADAMLRYAARAGAVVVLLMLAALVFVLAKAALPSVSTFGAKFVATTEWRPNELERPALGPDGHVRIEDGETVMETVPPQF